MSFLTKLHQTNYEPLLSFLTKLQHDDQSVEQYPLTPLGTPLVQYMLVCKVLRKSVCTILRTSIEARGPGSYDIFVFFSMSLWCIQYVAGSIVRVHHTAPLCNAFTTFSSHSWLAVDPWEVTRKRIMDYMSVLEHAREVCQETFPSHAGDISILYVCQTSQVRMV